MTKPPIVDVMEQKRLNEAREAGIPWKKWGPYLTERQWGTVREDYSEDGNAWALFLARSVAVARLPLGRRRSRRHLRRQAAAVLRARTVERARPDPEGAPVRPHQQRRQPRRGRQGVLLLPRQHADAFVHEVSVQVSAAGVPVSGPRRDEPAAVAGGVRVRTARHRRLRRRPLLRRVRRVREGRPGRHPHPHHRPQPRTRRRPDCTCCRRCGSATRGRGARTSGSRRFARPAPGIDRSVASRSRDLRAVVRRLAGAALHREREQRAAPLGPAQCLAVRQGRVPHLRHHGRRRSREPGSSRDESRGALRARRAGRREPDRAAAARGRRRCAQDAVQRLRRNRREPARDADEFYTADRAAVAERRRAPRPPSGAGRHAVEQAVLLLRSRAVADRAPEPPAARSRRGRACGTPNGSTCSTPT